MLSYKLEKASLIQTLATIVSFLISLSENSPGWAQVELPKEIKLALKKNASSISPLTVTWERQRTSYLSVPDVLTRFQLRRTALEFMAPEKVRFLWQDGMVYTYFWRHYPQHTRDGKFLLDKPLVLDEQEVSFNRDAYFSGNPTPGHKLLIIEPADKMIAKGSKALVGACPYLDQAGFLVPQTIAELKSKQPRTYLEAYLEEGARLTEVNEEKLDGVLFVVLGLVKENRKYRCFVDPAKNYAMRRRMVWSPSGKLEIIIDCLDLIKMYGSELWLPCRIRSERYYPSDPPDKPFLVETLTISELHNNPIDASQFELSYNKPGDSVSDGRLPGGDNFASGRVYYKVPANPDDLDAAIQAAIEGKPFVPHGFRLSKWRVRFFIAVNIVALMVLGWMLVRHYIKKRNPKLRGAPSKRSQP